MLLAPLLGVLLSFTAPLDVPFVRQVTNGCGSAAVAMVIEYWIAQTSGLDRAARAVERIDRDLRPSRGGLSGAELHHFFEAAGFSAYAFNGEFGDLRKHLAKGRPLIVCLGPARPEMHFVVVTGIDDNGAVLNDPARGKSVHQRLPEFAREWKASGNWTLLAVPRQSK